MKIKSFFRKSSKRATVQSHSSNDHENTKSLLSASEQPGSLKAKLLSLKSILESPKTPESEVVARETLDIVMQEIAIFQSRVEEFIEADQIQQMEEIFSIGEEARKLEEVYKKWIQDTQTYQSNVPGRLSSSSSQYALDQTDIDERFQIFEEAVEDLRVLVLMHQNFDLKFAEKSFSGAQNAGESLAKMDLVGIERLDLMERLIANNEALEGLQKVIVSRRRHLQSEEAFAVVEESVGKFPRESREDPTYPTTGGRQAQERSKKEVEVAQSLGRSDGAIQGTQTTNYLAREEHELVASMIGLGNFDQEKNGLKIDSFASKKAEFPFADGWSEHSPEGGRDVSENPLEEGKQALATEELDGIISGDRQEQSDVSPLSDSEGRDMLDTLRRQAEISEGSKRCRKAQSNGKGNDDQSKSEADVENRESEADVENRESEADVENRESEADVENREREEKVMQESFAFDYHSSKPWLQEAGDSSRFSGAIGDTAGLSRYGEGFNRAVCEGDALKAKRKPFEHSTPEKFATVEEVRIGLEVDNIDEESLAALSSTQKFQEIDVSSNGREEGCQALYMYMLRKRQESFQTWKDFVCFVKSVRLALTEEADCDLLEEAMRLFWRGDFEHLGTGEEKAKKAVKVLALRDQLEAAFSTQDVEMLEKAICVGEKLEPYGEAEVRKAITRFLSVQAEHMNLRDLDRLLYMAEHLGITSQTSTEVRKGQIARELLKGQSRQQIYKSIREGREIGILTVPQETVEQLRKVLCQSFAFYWWTQAVEETHCSAIIIARTFKIWKKRILIKSNLNRYLKEKNPEHLDKDKICHEHMLSERLEIRGAPSVLQILKRKELQENLRRAVKTRNFETVDLVRLCAADNISTLCAIGTIEHFLGEELRPDGSIEKLSDLIQAAQLCEIATQGPRQILKSRIEARNYRVIESRRSINLLKSVFCEFREICEFSREVENLLSYSVDRNILMEAIYASEDLGLKNYALILAGKCRLATMNLQVILTSTRIDAFAAIEAYKNAAFPEWATEQVGQRLREIIIFKAILRRWKGIVLYKKEIEMKISTAIEDSLGKKEIAILLCEASELNIADSVVDDASMHFRRLTLNEMVEHDADFADILDAVRAVRGDSFLPPFLFEKAEKLLARKARQNLTKRILSEVIKAWSEEVQIISKLKSSLQSARNLSDLEALIDSAENEGIDTTEARQRRDVQLQRKMEENMHESLVEFIHLKWQEEGQRWNVKSRLTTDVTLGTLRSDLKSSDRSDQSLGNFDQNPKKEVIKKMACQPVPAWVKIFQK